MSNPITQLKIQTLSQSGPKYEEGWDFLTTDLNQRAGGKYIYLEVFRRSVETLRLLLSMLKLMILHNLIPPLVGFGIRQI